MILMVDCSKGLHSCDVFSAWSEKKRGEAIKGLHAGQKETYKCLPPRPHNWSLLKGFLHLRTSHSFYRAALGAPRRGHFEDAPPPVAGIVDQYLDGTSEKQHPSSLWRYDQLRRTRIVVEIKVRSPYLACNSDYALFLALIRHVYPPGEQKTQDGG